MNRSPWRLLILLLAIGMFTLLIIVLLIRPRAETSPPSQSPHLTLTASPRASAQPTATPTHTLTPLPSPTRTPTPIRTPRPPTPTPYPLFFPRPILLPIATPQAGSEHYRLRDWTVEDAWSLVFTLEAYAQDLREAVHPQSSRAGRMNSEEAIRLVLQEAVRRFPQSSDLEALEWRMVMASALGLYGTEQDEQIIRLLEQGVQVGRYDLNDLDASLLPFGFQVSQTFTAENLFGDGRLNQVLVIGMSEPSPSPEGGILVAIREDQAGKVAFIRITSDWPPVVISGGFTDLVISDFTGDSQPEVLVGSYRHSGTMYGEQINIFQWREDQFVDVTPGGKGIDLDDFLCEWSWLPPDEQGNILIRTTEYIHSNLWEYNTYLWNGTSFEWSGMTVDLSEADFYYDFYLDLVSIDANTRIGFIEKIMHTWLGESGEEFGMSYADYLRFEEAMTYLALFDEDNALAILQAIVDDPYNQENLTVSRAAQTFVDYYHTPGDIYRACYAANWVMQQAFSEANISSAENYTDFMSSWGYSASGDFCDEEDAVYTLIDYWNSQQAASSEIATLLEQAGVRVLGRSLLDLNGDQLEDAVAMLQLSAGDGSQTFWLAGFVNSPSGMLPLTLYQTGLSTSRNPPDMGAFSISSYDPGGELAPVIILYVEDDLKLFRIETYHDQLVASSLYTLYSVTQYQLFRSPDALDIQVRFNPQRTYDKLGETLRYHAATQEFEVVGWQVTNPLGIPLASAARRAETLLLVENDPQAAIPLLEVLVSEPLPEDHPLYSQPESLYYLAWAYELTGDLPRAAQAYWQLWQTYPDSIYALIAFSRLEYVP